MGKRLNISFRQTHSERSATNAYRAYGKRNRRQNYSASVAKLLRGTDKLKSQNF